MHGIRFGRVFRKSFDNFISLIILMSVLGAFKKAYESNFNFLRFFKAVWTTSYKNFKFCFSCGLLNLHKSPMNFYKLKQIHWPTNSTYYSPTKKQKHKKTAFDCNFTSIMQTANYFSLLYCSFLQQWKFHFTLCWILVLKREWYSQFDSFYKTIFRNRRRVAEKTYEFLNPG